MKSVRYTNGFTLVEIIVVVAILGLIAAFSVIAFRNMYTYGALKSSTSETYGALTNARAQTLASEGDTVFGVHVASTSVTRFTGMTYTPGASGNTVYAFSGGVTATGTVIARGGTLVFSRLMGMPSATGTILLRNGDATSTVVIYDSGLIERVQ